MATEASVRASVIIPAFNSERFLNGAINSVLTQAYTNTECIVIDDGSTDNTRKIAESNDRVTYIYQTNAERSAARNNGISHASGQYISFLDADDFIAPSKIADQVAFLEMNPEFDAVYSKVEFFRDETPENPFYLERVTPSGDVLERLLYGNFITVHSPLIRKSAIEKVHGFNPALSHNEDWEFFLRLALSGVRFGFIDCTHAFCRMHAGNTSTDEIRMHESKLLVVRQFVLEHREELRQKGIATEPILAYHQADFGKALIANGRGKEGCSHIFNACRQPFPGSIKYRMFAYLSYILGTKMCARFGGGDYRN